MSGSLKHYLVREWWEDRVKLGTQLADPSPDDFTRGESMWFRTVAIQSLYRDFDKWLVGYNAERHRFSGQISRSGFMMILRNVIPGKLETVYARTGDGGRKRCLRFLDVERYRGKIAA